MSKQVTLTDINTGDIIYPVSTVDSIFDSSNKSIPTILKENYLSLNGGEMKGSIRFFKDSIKTGSIIPLVSDNKSDVFFEIMSSGALYLQSTTGIWMYGSVTCDKDITATAFNQSSDSTLKENIKNISIDDISKLDSICFKEFNFKNDESKTKRYGVIAQDVEKANLNNLVSKDNNDKLTVDYTSLLVLKIQQLENRIEKLEQKINQSNK